MSRKALEKEYPAPIGGLNLLEEFRATEAPTATVLENWLPKASTVDLRGGSRCAYYESGFSTRQSSFATLMTYTSPGKQHLLAATGSNVWKIQGLTTAAELCDCRSGWFSWTNFTTAGGSFLIAVNGVDKALLYNGDTMVPITGGTTPGIIGIDTSKFSVVVAHKNRLWFVEKSSLSVWYMPVASIGGTATEFPLGQLFRAGGHIVAALTWTIDGGIGADDHLVFLTSEGEVAVFKGSDPSSISTWALVGIYFVGTPVGGENSMARYGGDILILTRQGVYPLSKFLSGRVPKPEDALTYEIFPAFQAATASHPSPYRGWGIYVFQELGLLFVNVPTATYTGAYQFVRNLQTKAWTKFTGWDATSWTLFGGKVYFATRVTVGETPYRLVVRAFDGTSDLAGGPGDEQEIVTACRLSSKSFGNPNLKHVELFRAWLKANRSFTLYYGLDVDYVIGDDEASSAGVTASGSLWDTAIWGTDVWGGSPDLDRSWRTVFSDDGVVTALRLRTSTSRHTISWSGIGFAYQLGDVL